MQLCVWSAERVCVLSAFIPFFINLLMMPSCSNEL